MEYSELFQQLTDLSSELQIATPPMLEQALGYPYHARPDARYVSFYFWGKAEFDDGRSRGTADTEGFLAFAMHRKIWRKLLPYDLGSDDKGTHRLLLDRETRKLYVGTNQVVNAIVAGQWRRDMTAESEIPYLTSEQVQAQTAQLDAQVRARMANISNAEIWAMYNQQVALTQQLTDWLDHNA